MNEVEFEQITSFGREQRGVEFKRGGSRKEDKRLLVKVIRAVISMANTRDGGKVIIGIDEDEDKLILNGVNESDLSSWNHDDFADSVAEYAEPTPVFEIQRFSYKHKNYIIIEVDEFIDFPILCKKTYDDVLRSGACYLRPRRKPESIEIPSYVDMRDLLELAIDKGVRKFISRADKVGLSLLSDNSDKSDINQFEEQIDDFFENGGDK